MDEQSTAVGAKMTTKIIEIYSIPHITRRRTNTIIHKSIISITKKNK